MVKLYRQSIEVQADPEDRPVSFRWRRRWYFVTSYTVKKEKTWWRQLPRFAEALRYRCETGWVLERVWD